MPRLNEYRLSEIAIDLSFVIDCRDLTTLGITVGDLLSDLDYSTSQHIGAAAVSLGAEGLLVPSATRLGDNLIIFPDNLRSESRLEVISSRDPVLYVERS